jgi:hypothetical protein
VHQTSNHEGPVAVPESFAAVGSTAGRGGACEPLPPVDRFQQIEEREEMRRPPRKRRFASLPDLTWQAGGGVGCRFHRGDAGLVYRHVAGDFGSGSGLDDTDVSGPQPAAASRF